MPTRENNIRYGKSSILGLKKSLLKENNLHLKKTRSCKELPYKTT